MSVVGKEGYKETAIGWIPEDWRALTLGESVETIVGGGTPSKEVAEYWNGDIPWASVKDFVGTRLSKTVDYISAAAVKASATRIVPAGTLITPTRMALGKVAFFNCDVAINQDLKAIFPKSDLSKKYLFYWFQANAELIEAAGTGSTVKGIRLEVLRDFVIRLPTLPEQEKIAAILGTVDDKLDVIARQIDATNTLKRGLMQTLFSQGVGTQDANGQWHPHTEFQQTELGEIPACWTVYPLEVLSETVTVGIATSTTEYYVPDGIPLIRNQNIKEDYLDASELLYISEEFDAKNKNKRVKAGDILTVRTGYPGVSCVVPAGMGNVQTFTTLITRPKHGLVNANFVSRYFNSPLGKELMLHQSAGGAQQNINAGNLKKLLVPTPPMAEQNVIADILESADAKLNVLGTKQTHYQTLKRGLMQKLLTGEWRVKVA
ncbi:restriction endonuclease subunit S [Iodobacter fluviatilis]|uniref:Type I restriction enzyme EcoKI specificity protein n=1 Tax=Iodobacter fluviatilis TaxID=537 RepID=A0A377SV38_9NEIS|nr:restriction endonuclease subunit S [Iodobacter fluviatilis]TCU81334.1 type I restriction enzyme S subunit [Iodobacter fluviatilis]STR45190.1 Type I restriction enzyme EcoKI specificity protein [Iodobacter fluviatilis]